MKLPYSKVSRFTELPKHEEYYYLMFIEDIIEANIGVIFLGHGVDCSYCIKVSRDADIITGDTTNSADLTGQVEKRIKRRKVGVVCCFVYDRAMPDDLLDFLIGAFRIQREELVPGDRHLNLENLRHLPNPSHSIPRMEKPVPMKPNRLSDKESIFSYIEEKDLLLYYPYHSFDHFIYFPYEAVHNPGAREIMATQCRVAENSAVINTLIVAVQNGKKITVFTELKACFDKENNLATVEMMKAADISIIYSVSGLGVHTRVALIRRRSPNGEKVHSYTYISTSNFNGKTVTLYTDRKSFINNPVVVHDLTNPFRILRGKENPKLTRLLVARFNLIPELDRLINKGIELVEEGGGDRVTLKVNALQDPVMVDQPYEVSQRGIRIGLTVRGICCLILGQEYSRSICITRIVDSFLEHARIWCFGNAGHPEVYLGSPDWMRRNLYRQIEAMVPALDSKLREEIVDMPHIQLSDNREVCFVGEKLNDISKFRASTAPVRAQYIFYNYPKEKSETFL